MATEVIPLIKENTLSGNMLLLLLMQRVRGNTTERTVPEIKKYSDLNVEEKNELFLIVRMWGDLIIHKPVG